MERHYTTNPEALQLFFLPPLHLTVLACFWYGIAMHIREVPVCQQSFAMRFLFPLPGYSSGTHGNSSKSNFGLGSAKAVKGCFGGGLSSQSSAQSCSTMHHKALKKIKENESATILSFEASVPLCAHVPLLECSRMNASCFLIFLKMGLAIFVFCRCTAPRANQIQSDPISPHAAN